MSLNALITNSDDLDEQLSAEEFIKSLKKVESFEDPRKKSQSGTSSASGSSDKMASTKTEEEKKKAMLDKKGSASELLVKMRSRFQHRATEPVFHTLATNAPEASFERQSSNEEGSTLKLPPLATFKHEHRTDSAPMLQRFYPEKYISESDDLS
ncbi:hypothetical protein V3C99_014678 [Haemonchus contortus]